VRSLDARESDKLDETQLATWIEQAAFIPGWDGGSRRYGGISALGQVANPFHSGYLWNLRMRT
jgi:hypothetical protein